MRIIEIKAKKILAGPGTSWIAEALVLDENNKELYVTVHYFDGEYYTVSRQSVYVFFTDEEKTDSTYEFLESYEEYEDAEKSAFRRVFMALRNAIEMLE